MSVSISSAVIPFKGVQMAQRALSERGLDSSCGVFLTGWPRPGGCPDAGIRPRGQDQHRAPRRCWRPHLLLPLRGAPRVRPLQVCTVPCISTQLCPSHHHDPNASSCEWCDPKSGGRSVPLCRSCYFLSESDAFLLASYWLHNKGRRLQSIVTRALENE